MSMRIALVSSPYSTTPPKGYGPIEYLVSLLAEQLVRLGHEVTVFASHGSKTSGNLIELPSSANVGVPIYFEMWPWEVFNCFKSVRMQDQFDIIHNHTPAGVLYHPFVRNPFVHTVHNVHYEWYARLAADRLYWHSVPGSSLVSISRAQRKELAHPDRVKVVYNGIDTSFFSLEEEKEDYYLAIGRISRNKGFHTAIKFAIAMQRKLVIAGPIIEQAYFDAEIKPYLANQLVSYIGPVSGQAKKKLYQKAKALLFPVEWEEPFGLVMVEAMSCGTPVIANRKGSTSEIVRDGISGHVVDSFDEFCEAALSCEELDFQECRKDCVERFSAVQMTKNYEAVYKETVRRV